MNAYICVTCGTQYTPTPSPPPRCAICDEPRQYLRPTGQSWTTLDAMAVSYTNGIRLHEPNLFGIGTFPSFAIGQRALLVRTPAGNVLWDCISLLDQATIEVVRALGGISAIAISHPHYYTTVVEWSRAFNSPIYLHEADRMWVMRPDDAIAYWSGETREPISGLTLIRAGGHFAGGTMLHWGAGAEGRGALLSGDIIQVAPDRKFVSFMRSYPNMIPMSRRGVERIVGSVAPFPYEAIYGAFFDRVITQDAAGAVTRSASRYIDAITGDGSLELLP
jgi:glyoxylase-like metal-dependent hydrolase (beta-lactamase superfamily II)